jgi:hypothetical protein
MWIQMIVYAIFMVTGGVLCILQVFHEASTVFMFSGMVPLLLLDWDECSLDQRRFFWVSSAMGGVGLVTGAFVKFAMFG